MRKLSGGIESRREILQRVRSESLRSQPTDRDQWSNQAYDHRMFKALTRPRRVVITGMGCVTPLGIGREAFWNGLVTGKSGVRRIEAFDPSSFPVQIAAEVPSFDWQSQLNPKDRKHVPRTVPLALAAAREALEDAQLFPNDLSLDERRAIGVELGTAAAVSRSPNSSTSTGTLVQPAKRAFTRFLLPRTADCRASCRWRLACAVCRTSSRPVAPVRLMRWLTLRSTSRSAART